MKKIDESIVDQIRDLYSFKDLPIKVIAEKLNISESTVYKVIDDNCMATREHLIVYCYVWKYLIKIGKVSPEGKYRNGKFYPFDNITEESLKIFEEEYIPNYKRCSSMAELTEYYRRLAE